MTAIYGACARPATSAERLAEYDRLVSAAANGTLHAEARRFVATLFMTLASYASPIRPATASGPGTPAP